MGVLAFMTLVVLGLPVLYVGWRILPYAASLSAAAGIIFFAISAALGYTRGIIFFGGLFLFSLALFAVGGGMRAR